MLRDKFRKSAEIWLQSANLKFNWVADDATSAEIRFRFEQAVGSKSALGTERLALEFENLSI